MGVFVGIVYVCMCLCLCGILQTRIFLALTNVVEISKVLVSIVNGMLCEKNVITATFSEKMSTKF